MSKKLQFFLLFSLIINSYISQIIDFAEEKNNLRSLDSNPLLNISEKDANILKFHYQLSQTVYTIPINKNYYMTNIYIGESKKKQAYLIDTGSDIMSSSCFQESGFNSNKTNNIIEQNQNFTKIKCDSKICDMLPANRCKGPALEENKEKICSYDINGIKGFYVQDIAYLEEITDHISPFSRRKFHSYAVPIGCTTENLGKNKDLKVDGVLGLNKSPNSFIGLLYKLKIIKQDMFSLCLGPRGGFLSLGEIQPKYHYYKTINYVPFVESDTYYQIKVNCLYLGNNVNSNIGNNINNTNYIKADNIIAQINSGYNITYLPEQIYDQLIQQLNYHCANNQGCGTFQEKHEYGYCVSFSDRETLFNAVYKNWPEININLGKNETYIWKPFNYYVYHHENEDGPRFACLGFVKHKSPNIIFGTNFFHGYDIIFDRKEKQLGFVKADCARGSYLFRRSSLNHFYNTKDEEEKDRARDFLRKFHFRFNRTEDGIDFIRGTNTELNFSSNFKFINFILLSASIIILIIVAVSVISLLICNKKAGLKYVEPDVVIEQEMDNKMDEDNY